MPSEWDQVPATVRGLHQPEELTRLLRLRVQEAWHAMQEARGEVTRPEDTFDMQRRLTGTVELFKGYARAFSEATKTVGQLQEEELVTAVGEQDGLPIQALIIPDPDGDITVRPAFDTGYEIDLDQVLAILVGEYGAQLPELPDDAANAVTSILAQALETLLTLGKFELQVSKVKAYAATLARGGSDIASSVVTSAIRKTPPKYKGVTVTRKEPK